MCVKKHWEYRSNPMPSYTHRRCIVTLSNSCLHAFWYTCPPFSDTCFKASHCLRHKYLCMFLFTFEDNCFVQRVIRSVGHRVVLYIFNLPIVSMECMMSTNSRIGVLLLARIQLVRLKVAWKVFLETYGYVFHSALQNSLYQYAM